MASRNEHTGDVQRTRPANDSFRDNYDRIFKRKHIENEHKDTLTAEQCAAVDDTASDIEKTKENIQKQVVKEAVDAGVIKESFINGRWIKHE